MAAQKKSAAPEEASHFSNLEDTLTEIAAPVDLQAKALSYELERASKRETLNSAVTVFDLRDRVLSKASIKDISESGLRLEIQNVEISSTDQVFVNFTKSLHLGMVLCAVQWVTDLQGHREKHKLIGLKFKTLSSRQKKQLEEFLIELQKTRDEDPFYVG